MDELRLRAAPWRDFDNGSAIAQWDALAGTANEPNPFFESWYLLPALRNLERSEKVWLLVLEAGGVLLGIMPICRSLTYYHHPLPQLRNWAHSNCFLGSPLVASGAQTAFWRALLQWADKQAGTALFLHLVHVPLTGPLHETLQDVLAQSGHPAAIVMREERAMLASNLSPGSYLEQALSGKKRKELRRQHKRLSEQGTLTFEREIGSADLDSWTERFLKLEAAGWKGIAGSALSCAPATTSLFKQALEGAAQRGKLERLCLSLDGQPIAMLANFLAAPGAFSFKTAFDENYARFSPGVLLQRENLALLEHDEIEWCDSCASADHPMIDHFWRERREVGRISIGIGGSARQAVFRQILRRETGGQTEGIT